MSGNGTHRSIREAFPARLKYARKVAGFTAAAFAERIDLDAARYWIFEHGKAMPSVPVLCGISEQHGVSLDWLFEWPIPAGGCASVPTHLQSADQDHEMA